MSPLACGVWGVEQYGALMVVLIATRSRVTDQPGPGEIVRPMFYIDYGIDLRFSVYSDQG
jgi:hypothetical protein